MASQEYYATPAPHVEEANVESANIVEAARASPVAFTEAAAVDPCSPVEPATMYQATRPAVRTSFKGGLPTKQVRGETGADFESYAAVIKGAAQKNFLQIILPCLYDERDFVAYGEVKYYVLVKDGLCYIYVAETDPSPLYAIELDRYFAVQEDPRRPEKGSITISPMPNTNMPRETMKTILLKNKSDGKQAFQFTFDTEQNQSLAKIFFDLVQNDKKMPSEKERAFASVAPTKDEKS